MTTNRISPSEPRIVVVGTTGSGKTTLAEALSRKLGVPHIELDSLHWDPNWSPAEPGIFRRRVTEAVASGAWVVDGNYRQVRDLIWPSTKLVVWLDYSLPLILRRLLFRTAERVARRTELWNGNRENLRNALSSDSILIWALRTYRARRREYALLAVEHPHLGVVRLTSPRETEVWLASVTAGSRL